MLYILRRSILTEQNSNVSHLTLLSVLKVSLKGTLAELLAVSSANNLTKKSEVSHSTKVSQVRVYKLPVSIYF